MAWNKQVVAGITAKLGAVSIGSNHSSERDESVDEKDRIRLSLVRRKKDFRCMERVNGRLVNVLQGLELHTGVFNPEEQKKIVDYVYQIQEKGRNGELRERTYSEPRKWMKGKGRITIQFGCCYNYATDKNGNPPGIIRDEQVDPLPPLLKTMIKRMVKLHVLPPTCIPNSCIINIYDKDDCIPPHIDHHDFVRPFCTVSFLTECNILFGAELKVLGPGEFSGSTAIPLPVGSVLILSGNGADVAKHCVPAVPAKRISITFRKMDDSKLPYRFLPDPELQNIKPIPYPVKGSPVQQLGNRISVSPVQQQSPASASISPVQQQSPASASISPVLQQSRISVSLGQQQSPLLVSPVQQQSQQQTPPSYVRGVGSYPRSVKSGDKNDQLEFGKEKSVSPVQLSQDDFPPLGSGSGGTRKSRRSLRQ